MPSALMIEILEVGQLYSNDEIFRSLKVGNAGGIRLSLLDKAVLRAVVMTSEQNFHGARENPYHDRLESGILTYTAAGKLGEQTLAGMNSRLIEQKTFNFPIHAFSLIASRRDKSVGPNHWKYIGLLQYLRYYPDTQLDAEGKVRKVWLFEFKIHDQQGPLPLASEAAISSQVLTASRLHASNNADDDEIIDESDRPQADDLERIEHVRSKLLAMEPRGFEFFIKNLLVHCGFSDVCVTRFTANGGVDVSARAGGRIWILENTLVQVQAKRWLHSVGRKEVAELRGSLQPFARGAVVTTSHFSKAAINEPAKKGKIRLRLSTVLDCRRSYSTKTFNYPHDPFGIRDSQSSSARSSSSKSSSPVSNVRPVTPTEFDACSTTVIPMNLRRAALAASRPVPEVDTSTSYSCVSRTRTTRGSRIRIRSW